MFGLFLRGAASSPSGENSRGTTLSNHKGDKREKQVRPGSRPSSSKWEETNNKERAKNEIMFLKKKEKKEKKFRTPTSGPG